MPENRFTIHLTEDQQKQIQAATGKTVRELRITFTASGQLSDEQLDQAAGGVEILSYSFG